MSSRSVRATTAGAGVALITIVALALTGCADAAPGPTASATDEQPSAAPTEQASAAEVERDPELAAMLDALIVEDLPPVALRASSDIAAECGVEAGGCYRPEEPAIVVTSEWTDFRQPELLAHEYLHHVWERDGLGDDAELVAALEAAGAETEGLGALVPEWQADYVADDGSIMPTELFSYACTGLRDDQLPPAIGDRCAQYLQMDALPVAQEVTAGALHDEIDRMREAAGLAPLERDPHAAAASEARAELFTPHSQVPLSEYPESVTRHLDEGCAPARYGARLTRPGDVEQMVQAIDDLLQGALTGSSFSGIGIAVTDFDYIDARSVFDERTVRVNATLIVTTVCG